MFWHKLALTLHKQNGNTKVMKNTEYDSNILDSIVFSEDSLSALIGMIEDMDLEITGFKQSL